VDFKKGFGSITGKSLSTFEITSPRKFASFKRAPRASSGYVVEHQYFTEIAKNGNFSVGAKDDIKKHREAHEGAGAEHKKMLQMNIKSYSLSPTNSS